MNERNHPAGTHLQPVLNGRGAQQEEISLGQLRNLVQLLGAIDNGGAGGLVVSGPLLVLGSQQAERVRDREKKRFQLSLNII